ncbi:BatA domain-containing protein [candidate division KSB1 bacterium]|nr:BatA domain-containing protein [candidate division KSB1 bacterium]
MLGFLNSAFLFGLIGVSIPILIHLFARQRIKKIYFSSTTLLSELQIKQVRRLRFAQILILILRCLAIAFLVLAFARPTLQSGALAKTGEAPVSALLMIDRSLSLQRGRFFAEAQSLAVKVLDNLKTQDDVAIVWSDDLPADEIVWNQPGESIHDEILHSPLQFGKSQWPELLNEAVSNLKQTSRISKEIYWIWDMQKTAISSLQDSLMTHDAPVSLFVLPVSGDDNNVAIINGGLGSQILDPAAPVLVFADVKNFGSQEIQNLWVRVSIQGKSIAQKTITMKPGAQQRVEFALHLNQTGWIEGRIEIEDDILSADNRFDFVLQVPERIRVRLIGQQPQDLKYPEIAFRAFRKDYSIIEVESFTGGTAWTSGLQTDHVLLFCNYPQFTIDEADQLQAHIRQGGGALFILGSDVDLKNYSERLMLSLFAGSFQDASSDPSSQEAYWTLENTDWKHPLLKDIFKEDDPNLELPHIFKRAEFRSTSWTPILAYRDGVPLIAETHIQKGCVLILSTGLDAQWSDLSLQSLFTPFIYRSAVYLSTPMKTESEPLRIDDPLIEIVQLNKLLAAFTIVRPDEQIDEIIPIPRENTAILEYKNTDLPGVYRIQSDGETVAMRIVHTDPAESDCRSIDESKLKSIFSDYPITIIRQNQDLEKVIEQHRSGREIWREMLILAIVMLMAELILARHFVRKTTRRETE